MSRIENSNLSLKDIYFLLENPEEIKLRQRLIKVLIVLKKWLRIQSLSME